MRVVLGRRMGGGRPWRLPGGVPTAQHVCRMPRCPLAATPGSPSSPLAGDIGLGGDGLALSGPLESLCWVEGGPHSRPG